MQLSELPTRIHEAATVKRVFGEAYQADGLTVIPVARVRGAGGGGDDFSEGHDEGGLGLSVMAAPIGVYVVKDGDVTFVPAPDYVALATRAAAVAITGMVAWRSVAKARHKRKGKSRRS